MIQLGLTGSIGMGKSTVAAMFADAGVPVFDADAAVHGLQGPGGAALAAIETAFPGTTGPDGVDREALGARVLNDDAAMKQLEGIMHPMVAQMRAAFLAEHADAPLWCSTFRCCSKPAATRAWTVLPSSPPHRMCRRGACLPVPA